MTDKTPYYPLYPTDNEFDLLNPFRRFQFNRGFENSTHAADFVFSSVSNADSAFHMPNKSFLHFFSGTIFYF